MFIRRKNSHFMLSAMILTGKTIIPVHMNIKMKYESITNLLLICNFLCPCCAIPLLLYFLLFPSLTQVSWTQTSWNFHHNWCQLKSLEVHLFSGYTRAGSIYESLHKEHQHTFFFPNHNQKYIPHYIYGFFYKMYNKHLLTPSSSFNITIKSWKLWSFSLNNVSLTNLQVIEVSELKTGFSKAVQDS